jgi:hypothetical protein
VDQVVCRDALGGGGENNLVTFEALTAVTEGCVAT